MAIRDKFRRAVGSRKSTSSSSDSSSTHCAETSTIASSVGSETSSAPKMSRARTFTFRLSKTAEEKEQQQQQKPKPKKSRTWHRPDPREKPFTELNLRYQEMLGSYELNFGTTHPEQIWNPDGELSPGTSRHNSIDLERN